MAEYPIRRGDGKRLYLSRQQILDDINEGIADAADIASVPNLTSDDIDFLLEILIDSNRTVGVEVGKEVVLTYDIGQIDLEGDTGNSGLGIPISRLTGALTHERAMGADTFELAHADYSIKPVKPIIANEMQAMETAQNNLVIPYFYGAMPNMGLYYSPDGPYGNPADLMREFKIQEARESCEAAVDHLARDIHLSLIHI